MINIFWKKEHVTFNARNLRNMCKCTVQDGVIFKIRYKAPSNSSYTNCLSTLIPETAAEIQKNIMYAR